MKEKRKEQGKRKGRVAVSHCYPFIAARLAASQTIIVQVGRNTT